LGGMYPVTGDWVLMTDAVISRVLVRKNAFCMFVLWAGLSEYFSSLV
jgi:hypothetical protein